MLALTITIIKVATWKPLFWILRRHRVSDSVMNQGISWIKRWLISIIRSMMWMYSKTQWLRRCHLVTILTREEWFRCKHKRSLYHMKVKTIGKNQLKIQPKKVVSQRRRRSHSLITYLPIVRHKPVEIQQRRNKLKRLKLKVKKRKLELSKWRIPFLVEFRQRIPMNIPRFKL